MTPHQNEDRNYILCYTRLPQEDMEYAPRLAHSMHLAYCSDGLLFQELNHNSGVLFAKATENEDGTLRAKSLKNPYLFHTAEGNFGVIAVRTEAEGEADAESKGKVLLFFSSDLLQYREVGLLELGAETFVSDVICEYDTDRNSYVIRWIDELGNGYQNVIPDIMSLKELSAPEPAQPFTLDTVFADIEGILPRNYISVSREIARKLYCKLTVPNNIAIKVPERVSAASEEDLEEIRATALYSDGTKALKKVVWNTDEIDWDKAGTYKISGEVHQDHYPFPIAYDRADPCIAKWKGKYYFISTNDADHNHTLYMREADTIPGLVDAGEVLILDSNTYEQIGGLLWAPELHIIEEELYIFHAATPGEFLCEESHTMKLRTGGNPMCAADWSMPVRVVKKDGTYLCEAGKTISLDMTVIHWGGKHYAAWSERQFVPADLGAWIYIATMDPKEPWKLTSDPVLLTKPDYGWANNHTFVDEGPFALYTDDRLFVTFASAAVDATYVVGLLTAGKDADLLDTRSWTKGNYPLLTSRSVPGEYGPGHNSYVTDEDGVIWNAYHARPGIDGPRSSGLRRVHFDIDGVPVLDLTEDKDLGRELRKVSIEVTVR
ncbi:family 43 glycosylhydrolase [Paenibacillus sp. 19GGS1-52]|uniref:family 43 glycosylhydrolase n=1 Tax=Paenibacillus sp. 19GGS1-52 TaxID=2758563 RepID=UPI001EFB7122|nr:family 43 glycosylhydrolase [Paenibacillus sp. 19GGS1-52]ULO05262.1 family 43 glycosylhydrolase [Paenibacillus sp. 19GGS1-52]